jgi:cellulose synthase/poly-beta-1,6-N-acetylglucosamine synthase-like glycosyltransferase
VNLALTRSSTFTNLYRTNRPNKAWCFCYIRPHFRRAALDDVGGWDPFNVTEDADLGMRLARFGYRAETISRPTREPAPERVKVWMPQRTRWFKGWSQTWLVHMRDPRRLMADLGPASFVVAQVLFAGMLASAMLHPLLLVTFAFLVLELLSPDPIGPLRSALLLFDVVNIACGYLSFLLLGWQTLGREERRGFWKIVLLTPPYWVLLSLAGWRAIWQLWRKPHFWEKTPHEAPGNGRNGLNRAAGPARR